VTTRTGRVAGKVAFITGAARGQGRSHAVTLASQGADIIAIDLCEDIESNKYPLAQTEDLAETAALVEKQGSRIVTAIADVRSRPDLTSLLRDAVDQLGRLDIVVANAGIAPLTKGLPPQAFADAVDVDLVGVINTVHAALPYLEGGASIVATGSLAGFLGSTAQQGAGGAGYSFAKRVIAHYVNDLAVQLAPSFIRVNAVHPSNCNTDMLQSEPMYRSFRPDLENPTREDAEQAFPVMQAMPVPYVEPSDIANAVLFLASDESRYVTGAQLKVDAGAYIKAVSWSV
jgi:SDR family mycofactocin-dependent oxidoreductase